jgi:FtsP/CotA-like multicopper oxidase with cupredoxin domain
MDKRKFLIVMSFVLILVALSWRIDQACAQGFNPAVDYTKPNYANSPIIQKFMDSLPGLTSAGTNNLGQYIPIAVPDTTTYPGSDYYEIAVVEYSQKMHSQLPATILRGYVQLETSVITGSHYALPGGHFGVDQPRYLGPLVLAQRDRSVRVKFYNLLPTGASGNLFLPVDTTIMGAGMGPDGVNSYTQNRATLHLHGGLTPWISDGTPHQWVTPAGDPTPYKKGVSFQNVPDMVNGSGTPCIGGAACFTPALNDGIGTFYYPNQQSARLMFYHDHAYGITRLNVYAGEAAGYLLIDPVEQAMINGGTVNGVTFTAGTIPADQIPLVIQDKTFVNDATRPPPAGFAGTATPTTATVDPLWTWGAGGNLWFPHEYIPNENIFNPAGFNPMGRWDYAPFMIPPILTLKPVLPSPTIVPEAFQDTPVINGTAYPYVEVPPTAVRFRILNACNDRMLNLQLYKADPLHPTEVKMVPASPNAAYPTWPSDGRPGGVPDPATAGPDIIQIGNEGGFLAKVAVVPPQPVDFDYSRRSVTFGGVTSKALLLPPAVRADIIVDFSSYSDGDTLILYNDAPAPMPLYDTRYDYFTGDPDQTAIGGAPTTAEGFGPNTRTIMQIRIKGTATAPFDLAALQTALPKAFAVAQDRLLVPAAYQNPAYGTAYTDIFANSVDESLNVTGTTQSVAKVMLEFPGLGYTTPPAVTFVGGGGTGAAATATLNGVAGVTLVTAGAGCTTAPTVTLTPAVADPGTGATAAATISGGVVTVITITNPGSNYLVAPTVALTGGCTTAATATATITLSSVGAITLTNGGSGYTSAPRVYLTGGGGTGAGAVAMLNGALVMKGKNITEGFDMEYGRMNVVLGSTPSPLAPTVGAGPVIGAAFYIDPPTEILTADQTVLWRISHIGADSHSLHFHLFNVQVVNRVDWTSTITPPYEEELGWKETIRTNPFEDIIVAIRPTAPVLPFQIPQSNRLLDVTTPAASTANFLPVAPPIGIPAVAQTTNVMTNFGWEYVWHCHLLGHEENDMMRPLILQVAQAVVLLPGAPTGVTATGGNAQAVVSFTAPTSNGGSPITSYTVTSNPGGNTATRTASPITVTGLTNGTAYTFTVTATNKVGVGTGPASSPSNSVTPATVPGAPTIGTATAGNAQAVVSFAPGSNGGSPITSYTVTSSPGGITATGTASPITITGLTNSTAYTFTVTATNAVGTSPASAPSNSVTPGLPGAPTIGTATAGNAKAVVSFTAPASNGGSPITSYTVTSSPGGITATGTASPITVTGLTNGTAYTFTVTATNAVGTGPASSPSNSVTLPTVPGAPTIGTATAGNAQAMVSFTAPASNGGSPITSYMVTSSPGGITATGTASPITVVTGLTNGTPYTFTVTATNAVGTGPASAPSNSVVPSTTPTTAPAAPTNLTFVSSTRNSITLSWTDNAINEHNFQLQRSSNGTTGWATIAPPAANTTTYTNTGRKPNTTYYYRVRAHNSVGNSVWTSVVSGTTLP